MRKGQQATGSLWPNQYSVLQLKVMCKFGPKFQQHTEAVKRLQIYLLVGSDLASSFKDIPEKCSIGLGNVSLMRQNVLSTGASKNHDCATFEHL